MAFGGCGGSSDNSNSQNNNSNTNSGIEGLEAELRNSLNAYSTTEDFTLYIKSTNGNSFVHSTGSSTENGSYESASTSKLVTSVLILSLVEKGVLSLEDNPQDYIASWPVNGNLSSIRLRHLLSFTSGLSNEPLCINGPNQDFETCVGNIALVNNSSTLPGEEFYYSSSHLQVAGLMAIMASGSASWNSLFVQFQSETGLFPNSTYNLPSDTNPRLAGGMHWTASDYVSFLESLYNRQVLTESLFSELSSDQLGTATVGESPPLNRLGEDWHYGFGVWIECPENPFNCNQINRISSPGAYGAYPFIDFENGYYGIVARQGALGTFPEGVQLFESVSQQLDTWAAME